MSRDQVVMGLGIALLCVTGLWNGRWFLEHTRKGQRLVGTFGDVRALWVLRFLFVAGAAFGLLLAADVIRPIQW